MWAGAQFRRRNSAFHRPANRPAVNRPLSPRVHPNGVLRYAALEPPPSHVAELLFCTLASTNSCSSSRVIRPGPLR